MRTISGKGRHDRRAAGHAAGVTTTIDEAEAFRRLYQSHFDVLLAYAVRRVATPADAADVVSETFLVAWRRWDKVPAGEEARLWLYGVARNVLANQHRGERRRDRLGARLRERLESTRPVPEDQTGVREALATLPGLDREVLTLSAWEQLEPREIAEVLGISAEAARARLSRARRRLRDALGHDASLSGHLSVVRAEVREELDLEEGR